MKQLRWICLICWSIIAIGETANAIMGVPISISWSELLIRNWALVIACITSLIEKN